MVEKNKRFLKASLSTACIFLFSLGLPFAQDVPPPEQVLGFKVGADYHLATYDQALDYLKVLEKSSPMVKLVEMGKTSMGKSMVYAIITSEENIGRLDHFKEISRKLALVEGLTDEEAQRLAAEGKAVVYIEGGVHAPECAPAQSQIQLAYDLVTSQDPNTKFILENVIFLLVLPNPDGMQLLAEWYHPNVGTPYEVSPMPWLYHKYAGHDTNRDTFMGNLVETRHIVRLVNREWYPVVFHSHHQRAPFPARIWIPPAAEPMNPNTHPLFTRGRTLIGSAMGFDFDQWGKEGAISRILHSFWYAGYMDWFFGFFNVIATLTETALYHYATPHHYTLKDFPEDYRDFTKGTFYPNPWKGGWWRFSDAVEYSLLASKSVLSTAALYRSRFLYAKYVMGRDTIARFRQEPPYAWIIPQKQWDPPVAARMLNWLIELGIDVYKAQEPFDSEGLSYPEGTWIIPMTQPFSLCLKAIFEEQNYPDMGEYPTLWQGIVNPRKYEDAYHPPWDTAGWTLQYQMGVKVVSAAEPLEVRLSRLEEVRPPAGRIVGDSGYAYLLSPRYNNSYLAANRILKKGGQLLWARESFQSGGESHPPGTMIVLSKDVPRSFMTALAKDLSIFIRGAKGRLNAKSSRLKTPRIALYQSWKGIMDEGWTRWLLEQYEFSLTSIHDSEIRAGNLNKKYDVLLIPSMLTKDIVEGHKQGTMPPQYVGGLGSQGVRSVQRFIEQGGTLVTLNAACHFAIDKIGVPVKEVLKGIRPPMVAMGPDPMKIKSVKFACPGSLLNVMLDRKHPISFGMPERTTAMFRRSPAFDVPAAKEETIPVVVAKYPDENPLVSGYLLGDEHLRNRSAIVDVPYGKGRVLLLGLAVQNRAQPHGTFKLLFNSLYYGTVKN